MAALRGISQHLALGDPVRILAIGSSSTQGVGASSAALSYPTQLQAFLQARWNTDLVTVENAGIGGETAVQTVERLEVALQASPPDLVIWQVGTNDAVKGGDEVAFRALLARGIAAAEGAGVEMILLDQQYFTGIEDLGRYEGFVRAVREVGEVSGVPVFSRYGLMKAWAELGPGELQRMLSADGFHMSDHGYTCLTRSLGDVVARRAQPIPAVAGLPGRSAPTP